MTPLFFLEVFLVTVAIYWGLPFVLSMAYVLWLWLLSRDVRYEGLIWWRGVFPVWRFRFVSRKSWYARLWARVYGSAMFCVIIHKDEVGPEDDRFVEKVIVHEMRHVLQQWCFGVMHWILYGLHSAYLAVFTSKDPYKDNYFERDARAATARWVMAGRPWRFDLGKRR